MNQVLRIPCHCIILFYIQFHQPKTKFVFEKISSMCSSMCWWPWQSRGEVIGAVLRASHRRLAGGQGWAAGQRGGDTIPPPVFLPPGTPIGNFYKYFQIAFCRRLHQDTPTSSSGVSSPCPSSMECHQAFAISPQDGAPAAASQRGRRRAPHHALLGAPASNPRRAPPSVGSFPEASACTSSC